MLQIFAFFMYLYIKKKKKKIKCISPHVYKIYNISVTSVTPKLQAPIYRRFECNRFSKTSVTSVTSVTLVI